MKLLLSLILFLCKKKNNFGFKNFNKFLLRTRTFLFVDDGRARIKKIGILVFNIFFLKKKKLTKETSRDHICNHLF